uniref:pyridoxal 5'-phosphate synthase glutaminase subunit PdxT n=1 Tax=uncultured Bilophila sp. TaxID=529385 RepID=UPI00280A99B3
MAAASAPRIGVLAIQGAFREHVRSLCLCGAEAVEIRTREDLEGLSGLVFPGGESTVMGKFLIEWGMMGRVRELIQSGMPVFGTCAGLILLCSDILDHPEQPRIGLLNASVRRNAFGRQIDSFTAPLELRPFPAADGKPTDQAPLEAVFIRAPLIEEVGPGVEVLA